LTSSRPVRFSRRTLLHGVSKYVCYMNGLSVWFVSVIRYVMLPNGPTWVVRTPSQWSSRYLTCVFDLKYLSKTPVYSVTTIDVAFLQCTIIIVFVRYTSRGYSVTAIDVAFFTMHNYYSVCQIHQLWEHQDNELGSFYNA
jgi:hypothetical protein